jgi:hypothetical protein
VLALLAATMVLAPQRASAGTPEDQKKSRQFFEEADALANQGRWKDACLLFQAAHDLNATNGTAYRTGECYENTGEDERALGLFQYVIDHGASDRVPERVLLAQKHMADLEQKIARAKAAARQAPVGQAPVGQKKRGGTPPPKPKPLPLWPAIAGGSVAIVGIAVGGTLTVLANGKAADVTRLQSGDASRCYQPAASVAAQCTQLHDAATSRVALSNGAQATFIVGGVFALASVGLGIGALVSRRSAPVQITPTVGAGHAGLVLQGDW